MTRVRCQWLLFALLASAVACHAQTPRAAATSDDDEELGAGGPGCGVERWDIKTGIDTLAPAVNVGHPQAITVARLLALPRPDNAAPDATLPNTRQAPYERRAFILRDVTLRQYQTEADHDFHLIIGDAGGATMVVEIPHPGCVDAPSPWRDLITAARRRFEARFANSPRASGLHETMTVVGVGFFDRVHEVEGSASNGIELHPVTALCFGAGCEP